MENSTVQPNISLTTPHMDHQVEPWKIAVPLFLIILLAVFVASAILVVIYCYKRCYKRNTVFPVIVVDGVTSKTEPPPHDISRKIITVRENSNLSLNTLDNKSSLLSVNSLDDFKPTRTKSLTLVLPKGKTFLEVFCNNVDTDEFQELDKMNGKLRWQITLLEVMDSDQQSHISLSDNEQVTETQYRQGVYMNWENTLHDLRNAFIETRQIEREEAAFCFLWTDVPGEHIDVASESSTCLNELSRSSTVTSRTVYIERVDPEEVKKCLCICGKHSLFQCSHCQDRGYCSHRCQQEDTSHIH